MNGADHNVKPDSKVVCLEAVDSYVHFRPPPVPFKVHSILRHERDALAVQSRPERGVPKERTPRRSNGLQYTVRRAAGQVGKSVRGDIRSMNEMNA